MKFAPYTSGRLKQLKVGITSYSEDKTPLEVVGNVSVGGTIQVTNIAITSTTSTSEFSNLNISGVSTFNDNSFFNSNVAIGTDNVNAPVGVSNTSILAVGILTANRIYSTVFGEFTGGSVVAGNIVGTALSISGISTLSGPVGLDSHLSVSGVSTFNGVTTFNNADVVFQGAAAGQNITFDASENDLEFTDSARLKFGNSDDLEIWHAGNSHIKNSTNDLKIRSDSLILKRADDSEAYLKATVNEDVKIYYNGNEKFATTGVGVTVLGTTETQQLNVSGIASASAFANFDYLQAPFGSTVNFTVTVAGKDATHRYNGTGSGSAYLINGVQAPFLTLTPGRTYRFTNNNTGSHPLKFYLEADKTTEYTSGVSFQNTYTEITVSDQTPVVLHYQCVAHGYMGNAVQVNSNVVNTNYPATLRDSLTVSGNINANGNIVGDSATNISGINSVTATDFSGNISGVGATFTNITGTLQTAAQTNITSVGTLGSLTVSGNINANGNIIGDNATNISGINSVTATSFFGDGSNLTGIAATDNVRTDSLVVSGVSTFNDNVNLPDNKKIQLGDNGDLQLYHNGTSSYIDNNTGAFYIRNNVDDDDGGNIIIEAKSGKASAVFQDDEGVRLYYNDAEKIATTGYGVTVNGTTQTQQLNVSGVSTLGSGASAQVFLQYGGSTKLKTQNWGVQSTGTIQAISGRVETANVNSQTEGYSLKLLNSNGSGGTKGLIEIGHTSNNSFITGHVGNININAPTVAISTNMTVGGISTFAGNINANGNIVGDNATNISGINSVTATSFFGNGAGLTNIDIPGISTSGTSNFNNLHVAGVSTFVGLVTVTNGDVHIAQRLFVGGLEVEGGGEGTFTGVSTFTNQTDNVLGNSNTGAVQINGGVGIDKNLTVGAGLSVVNGFEVGGISTVAGRVLIGTTVEGHQIADDLTIADTSGSGTAGITIRSDSDKAGRIYFSDAESGDGEYKGFINYYHSSDELRLGTDGVARLILDSSGHLQPYVDSTYDLGITGTRWRNVYADGLYGTLQTAAQPNVTSLGTLSSLNVTGNVTIGGTLTYEDVTNVDSIGLITARTGIKVLAGGINVVGVSTFGSTVNIDDGESILFANGLGLIKRTATDGFKIESSGSNNIHIEANSGGGTAGDIVLQSDDTTIIEVPGDKSGVIVTGILTATSFSGSGAGLTNINIPGISTSGSSNFNNLEVQQLNVSGVSTFAGNIVGDNATNISGINSVTATSFFGSGANLTNLPGIGTDESINTTGIITAASFSGDGQDLDKVSIGSTDGNFIGKGYLQAQKTVNAGGDRGDANIILGRFAGCCHDGGSYNVYLGDQAGRKGTGSNTDRNVFIGCQAGCGNTTGYHNVFLGSEAGKGICGDSGSVNLFAGLQAGMRNTGCYNIAFGKASYGRETGTKNISIGHMAATDVGAGGTSNVFIGDCAGYNAQVNGPPFRGGLSNVYLGTAAGYQNPGDFNIGIGDNALNGNSSVTAGCRNIALGQCSGNDIQSGVDNIMLGSCAGAKITTGGCNILLGYNAGCNATGSFRNVYVGTNIGKTVCGGAYDISLGSENLCDSKWACNNIAIGKNIFKKANCQGPSADALFNIGIGDAVGTGLTTGGYNLMLGYLTGYCLTCACDNIIFGKRAGWKASESTKNIFIGCYAGRSQGSAGCAGQANIAIGNLAGSQTSSTSDRNIFIGNRAGAEATGGCFNIALGADAATYLTGDRNIFIGQYSGFTQNVSGDKNVVIGDAVCLLSATGSTQLVIGAGATHWIDGDSSFNVTLAGIATVTKSTGVVEATKFCGDGSCLSGVGFSPDAQENLVAGTGAGASKDADTCFNIMLGCNAGNALNAGDHNILLGYNSGKSLTSGGSNIFLGRCAGLCVTDKSESIFIGDCAGKYSTGGSGGNILIGQNAGQGTNGNTNNGEMNIAIGTLVMACKNTAIANTVIGNGAGKKIDTGSYNTAMGRCAGRCISSGSRNIAIGCAALGGATVTGNCNVVLGNKAALDMTSGYMNIIIGDESGENMTAADSNIVVGFQAGENLDGATVSSNILLGYRAGQGIAGGTSVSNNIFLGKYTGRNVTSDASNNVSIGRQSAKCITSACSNTFIGNYAGCRVTTGCNLYIGHKSGNGGGSNITGTHNIAIGYNANVPDITGNTQFVIGCCTCNWIVGNSNFNVGIGTTNPDLAVGVGNTAKLAVGIVSAYQFYGDASQMTGAGFTQDAQGNLVAGTNAGANKDADTCFNVFIGCNAGEAMNQGDHHIFIGQNAGRCGQSTLYNIGLGKDVFCSLTSGHNNLAMGYIAARSMTSGCCNLFFGAYSGFQALVGANNAAFGTSTLKRVGCCGRGDRNSAFGDLSGSSMSCGCDNTFIGYCAGSTTQSGSNNVLIGSCVRNVLQNDSNFLAIGVKDNRWIVGNCDFNVGIGTTNPNAAVGVGNTNKLSVGILSAYQLYGDGSNLSGVGFSQDSNCNLIAGHCAGTCAGASPSSFNIIIGCGTGCFNGNGEHNVVLGTHSGKCAVGARRNVLIGMCAGTCVNNGKCNVYIGNYSGANQYCSDNIAIGCKALCGSTTASNNTGNNNVALGRNAGANVTSGCKNILLGCDTGKCITTGYCNVFIGSYAGVGDAAITGYRNTVVGDCAGVGIEGGYLNAIFGHGAGNSIENDIGNTLIGACSGRNIRYEDNYNTFIGFRAGRLQEGGCGNVIIGACIDRVPYYCDSGGSANEGCQLVIGYQSNVWLSGNKDWNVGVGTTNPSSRLSVSGDACVSGVITASNFAKADGSSIGGLEADAQGNLFASNTCSGCNFNGTNAENNILFGCCTGKAITCGDNNIFMGKYSGDEVNIGSCNIGLGWKAGSGLTTACCNVYIGACAGFNNSAGDLNTAIGPNAALQRTGGSANVFIGRSAGTNNGGQTGSCNIGIGFVTLGGANSDADFNIAIGQRAGKTATSGGCNIFLGLCSAENLTTGGDNIVLGRCAMQAGTVTGSDNIILGQDAGKNISAASNNVWIGKDAGKCANCGSNVFIGEASGKGSSIVANNTTICSVAIGQYALCCVTNGSNNTALGVAAGQRNGGGNNNTFVGRMAGYGGCNEFSGFQNTIIGAAAGQSITVARGSAILGTCAGNSISTGCYNSLFGYKAGCDISTGNQNIAIGCNVQLPSATGNNQLAIGNGTNRWITGNNVFNVGIGTTNPKTDFQVGSHYGVVGGGGTFTAAAGVAHTINEYTIASTDFKTAEYTIFANTGSKIQSQKLLVMQDGTTAYSQEYAVMSSDTLLVSADATLASGVVKIEITPETGVSGLTTFRFTRHTML